MNDPRNESDPIRAAGPAPESVWKHWKGGVVFVRLHALRESDRGPCIVYEHDGANWVRPLEDFMSWIDQKTPRFAHVGGLIRLDKECLIVRLPSGGRFCYEAARPDDPRGAQLSIDAPGKEAPVAFYSSPVGALDVWVKHADHIARGQEGEEKTIGTPGFDPAKHCSRCRVSS